MVIKYYNPQEYPSKIFYDIFNTKHKKSIIYKDHKI